MLESRPATPPEPSPDAEIPAPVSDRLFGIFGTGRSGSTWLGAIVDTHPSLAYRFEPFHRLRQLPALRRLRERIESGHADAAIIDPLHRIFRRADPRVSRPPFFRKDHGLAIGRAGLWPLARSARLAAPVYRRLYTPSPDVPIVFKEVNLERIMAPLLHGAGVRTVYLVRHPCGVVSSVLRGQQRGLMPAGRRSLLPSLLPAHDPTLAERYLPRLEALSLPEQEALLWRINVEKGIAALRGDPRGLLLVYEALCRDPLPGAERVFSHFGLDLPEQTRIAIREMGAERPDSGWRRKDRWSDSYFSVFRDPIQAAERWREDLPPSERDAILGIVHDSEAFQLARSLGRWD